jgi:hypothetical protein
VPKHTPAAPTGTFVQNGEIWTISYSDDSFSLKDIIGLTYVRFLLQHPGEEFHAMDLMRGPGVTSQDSTAEAGSRSSGLSIGGLGDAGEMLDPQAKREYRRRLGELRTNLAELRERGDAFRGEQVEAEIDFIERELMRAIGLGGRDRRAASAAQHARVNVGRAIRAALQKISEQHATLGELLGRSIKTGLFCRYVTDPQNPTTWRFSLESRPGCTEANIVPPSVNAAEPNSADAEPYASTPIAERRHLTVLFSELVTSMGLARQLDPEEWQEIVGVYHRAVVQEIERFGGHLAQSVGNRVIAYFGWPIGHDNNAELAARAGLAILNAISKLNEQSALLAGCGKTSITHSKSIYR